MSLWSIWKQVRRIMNLLKNLLMLILLCLRRLDLSKLQRRKHQVEIPQVCVLHRLLRHRRLIRMKGYCERLLSSIPEFSSFGKLFKSSEPVELTEAETEYAVNAAEHVSGGQVVFQYNCTNTTHEQLLENVSVIVDASEAEEFSEVAVMPLRSLPYDSPGQTFAAFEKPEGVTAVVKEQVKDEVDRVKQAEKKKVA